MTPTTIADLIRLLVRHGNYGSEAAMARAFAGPPLHLRQQTVNSWKAARGRPPKFQDFLAVYAERHGLDVASLTIRWEFVLRSETPSDRDAKVRPHEPVAGQERTAVQSPARRGKTYRGTAAVSINEKAARVRVDGEWSPAELRKVAALLESTATMMEA